MIKAIIFDRDGVLADSNKVIISAYQMTGKELGYKVPSRERVRKLLGRTYPEVLENLYGKDKKVIETYDKIWRREKFWTRIELMPGLKKTMEKIKPPKAIVTAGTMRLAKLVLKDSLKLFKVVITMSDTKKSKPHAEPLLLACKKLKVRPREAVYVGDMVVDYKTAKNAGTKFIGFLSNGSTRKEFKQAGVKILIKSLDDLPKVLGEFGFKG